MSSEFYIGTAINILVMLGGLVTIYVRISERLTRLETHIVHILGPNFNRRSTDLSNGDI